MAENACKVRLEKNWRKKSQACGREDNIKICLRFWVEDCALN